MWIRMNLHHHQLDHTLGHAIKITQKHLFTSTTKPPVHFSLLSYVPNLLNGWFFIFILKITWNWVCQTEVVGTVGSNAQYSGMAMHSTHVYYTFSFFAKTSNIGWQIWVRSNWRLFLCIMCGEWSCVCNILDFTFGKGVHKYLWKLRDIGPNTIDGTRAVSTVV